MTSVAERIARERRLVGLKRMRYGVDFAAYYHRWYNDVLLELLPPDRSLSVLDCGCGTGVLLPSLRRRYRRTVGLDLCRENLVEAQRVEGHGSLLVGDIENLPLSSHSFDQIVCRGVLHRLTDVALGLEQLFAALKDGGHLVISEPISNSRALRVLRAAAFIAGMHPFPEGRIQYPSVQEWIAAANRVGFRAVRWFHLGYVAFPLLGFPEAISLIRSLPGRMPLAKILLCMDRVLANVPVVKTWSWHAVFQFEKPLASSLRGVAAPPHRIITDDARITAQTPASRTSPEP